MLKVFRAGLAIDTSAISIINVGRHSARDEMEFPFYVEANNENYDRLAILEWFETREDAEKYVSKIADEINRQEAIAVIDKQDLKKFASLPSIFTGVAEKEIQSAVSDYEKCKSFIVRELERVGGEYGFKNPVAYDKVKKSLHDKQKLLTVLEEMRKEYLR